VCVCVSTGGADVVRSDVSDAAMLSEQLETLRAENARLLQQLQQQKRERQSMSRHSLGGDCVQLDFIHAQQELSRCKETLLGSLLTIYLLT